MELGFENGTITLDHEKGIYYPRQIITGSIKFRLGQQAAVTAIVIRFLGEARVLWTEHEMQQRQGRSFETQVEYRAEEQYFNVAQCLYGGQGVNQLNAGPHTFPFQFQIPPTVPSSFRGDKGEIAYEICATMEGPEQGRATMHLTPTLRDIFTVVSPIDLNKEDPEIAQPVTMEFEEVYSCGCACSPSPVTIDVSLPVSGYCPGQAVPVTIDVSNKANVEVKKIVLQIVTRTRYHSRQPVADFTTPEEVLASGKTKPVLSNMERHFTCDLLIPDMIAPNLNNCSIIDVGYFFKVIVQLSGCNDDIEDTSEISIGQIPLHNFTDGQYVHPMTHSLPSGPIPEQISQTAPLINSQSNPVNAYPGYQPHYTSNPVNAYPGYQPQNTQANPANAYPGYQQQSAQANSVNAYPGYQHQSAQATPVNGYPGYQQQSTQANPVNAYPGFQPQSTYANPVIPYPGFQPQPSVHPTAPILNSGYPNNKPVYEIGFTVDAPVNNQALRPV